MKLTLTQNGDWGRIRVDMVLSFKTVENMNVIMELKPTTETQLGFSTFFLTSKQVVAVVAAQGLYKLR